IPYLYSRPSVFSPLLTFFAHRIWPRDHTRNTYPARLIVSEHNGHFLPSVLHCYGVGKWGSVVVEARVFVCHALRPHSLQRPDSSGVRPSSHPVTPHPSI